jgi:hypothetical protein
MVTHLYIDCPVREPIHPAPHPSNPNAGEDKTAETDDSARVDGERLECPHERLSAGEVHRSLGMGNARECERKEGGSHHAESVGVRLL